MRSASDVLQACNTLAAISEFDDGIKRVFLSEQHRRANDQVSQWATSAGFENWQDSAGNFCARLEGRSEGLPALLLGSHLDTVPYAGRYDGILGVMIGLAVMNRLKDKASELPFALELIGFSDEEGTRFGVALFGSAAIAGQWNPEWWQVKDEQGISLREAFIHYGLDPEHIGDAARDPDSVIGYLEAHIEQGPVLEAKDRALGCVTAIAGARRFDVSVTGQASHAGTTPFELRRDALCAASEMVLAIETMAKASTCVATVGRMEVKPGAVNVIPGEVQFSIDIRSASDDERDVLWNKIETSLTDISKQRSIQLSITQTHNAGAQQCAPELQQHIINGIKGTGDASPLTLFSGAGHDAMAVGHLTDVAMLFIRCEKGVSHHPDEAVTESDVAKAIDAFEAAVLSLAEQYND